jgi:hypothetical protein
MADKIQQLRAFVASPGDVKAERTQLERVVREINQTVAAIAPEKRITLELVRWETNVAPGLGRDAQDVVNRQIGPYDIFVGIMWKRFGTPTAVADSGTEEEFRRAFETWTANPRLPVLFYFCQAPSPPPSTLDEIEQLGKVLKFRNELSQKGLVWDYGGPADFADVVRPHLIMVLGRLVATPGTPAESVEAAAKRAPPGELASARRQIAGLAREYDDVREQMPSGEARTRRMTLIESRMRTLALSIYPLLPELTQSASAGERLAAVAALKELPEPSYLPWLAERVGSEKPFVGYQATLALESAARAPDAAGEDAVRNAIKQAQGILSNLQYQDPNQVRVLRAAESRIGR